MALFNVPPKITYEDWVDSIDDGRAKANCHMCSKRIYPDDTIVHDDHLDIVYCSDTCFLNHWEAGNEETVEDFGGYETTLIDVAIDEWETQRYG